MRKEFSTAYERLVCACGNLKSRYSPQCRACDVARRKASAKRYVCKACGTLFVNKRHRQDEGTKYCSRQCGMSARSLFPIIPHKIARPILKRWKARLREEVHAVQPRILVKDCPECGKPFARERAKANGKGSFTWFCSDECRDISYERARKINGAISKKKEILDLKDRYIRLSLRNALRDHFDLPASGYSFPQELIEAKRAHLKLIRLLRKGNAA